MIFQFLMFAFVLALAWTLLSWRLGTARNSEWLQSQSAWSAMTSGFLAFLMLILAMLGAH